MASQREIKRRIKSVQNTRQITKAMEMVSAVKMRKAQDRAALTREYARYGKKIALAASGSVLDEGSNFLARKNGIERDLILLISSDRGLCGGFNANLFRALEKFLDKKERRFDFLTVGQKAENYIKRKGEKIIASFAGMEGLLHSVETRSIAKVIFVEFKKGNYARVYLCFNRFLSTTTSEQAVEKFLPIEEEDFFAESELGLEPEWEKKSRPAFGKSDYLFEPSAEKVLNLLLPRLSEMRIFQAVLESNASEHSARMVAMHNANKNSKELLDDLTFSYNRSRQESITNEILEISSGAEAMRGS